MKTTIATLASFLVALTLGAQSPSPTAAPIVIPTLSAPTPGPTPPVRLVLSPAQVTALVNLLAAGGITLPPGVTNINIHVLTTGPNAGEAIVVITF